MPGGERLECLGATEQRSIEEVAPRKPTLAAHIERAIARLTALRAGGARSAAFNERLDRVVRELDHLAADGRAARGVARAALIERLQTLDDELGDAATEEASQELTAAVMSEADAELAPFLARMPEQELARARTAACARLLRDAFGLPRLTYE